MTEQLTMTIPRILFTQQTESIGEVDQCGAVSIAPTALASIEFLTKRLDLLFGVDVRRHRFKKSMSRIMNFWCKSLHWLFCNATSRSVLQAHSRAPQPQFGISHQHPGNRDEREGLYSAGD